jgi:hypothetical protein
MSIRQLFTTENSNFGITKVENDKYIKDNELKLKLREINLIKHNPNLFTNRGSHELYDMIGGDKTALTILGCAALGFLYRTRCNQLRNVAKREGVWYSTLYLLYGMSLGIFYSSVYFVRWQVLLNEYFAFFLFKRFKGSNELDRKNIYHLKDVENSDECYRFSQSYANSYHM